MQTYRRMRWIGWGTTLALVAGLLTACESSNTGTSMKVMPASATLAGVGATVVLEASLSDDEATTNMVEALYLPLTWEVSNSSLGRIMSTAGYTAIYESNGKVGQNYITVQDQAGKEGTAAVEQRDTVAAPSAGVAF